MSNPSEFDRWIDDALTEYSHAEPRTGFASRVLACIESEEEQSRRRNGWRLSFALAVAAILLVTVLCVRQPKARLGNQIAKVAPEISKPTPVVKDGERVTGQITLSRRSRNPARAQVASPKQQQFPAAMPLTDQERMLVQYVRDFPEHAALIAQVQTDLRKRDELTEKESKNLDRKE